MSITCMLQIMAITALVAFLSGHLRMIDLDQIDILIVMAALVWGYLRSLSGEGD